MVDWVHAGPSMLAAFLASLVEFVEALTVVLAVGIVRGWRPALTRSRTLNRRVHSAGGVAIVRQPATVTAPAGGRRHAMHWR
jgi:uncharacterized membrane protein